MIRLSSSVRTYVLFMIFMFSAGRKSAGLASKRFIYRGIKIPLAFRALPRIRFAFYPYFWTFIVIRGISWHRRNYRLQKSWRLFSLRAGFAELSIDYHMDIEQ
jgi:hypothetical protein